MNLLSGWFKSGPCPIGIDMGSEALKLAQVSAPAGQGARTLVAASCTPLPADCRNDPATRIEFFRNNIRGLLGDAGFAGRRAVLALPASFMLIRRLRLPRMDEAQTKSSVLWETRGKLPFNPSQAMLRHVIAGEVYRGTEVLSEVIVMATPKDLMARYLAAAASAKVDVVGMAAEPQAVAESIAHAMRGTTGAGATQMVIDLGSAATRVYIARGPQLMFARVLPIGAQDLDRAVAAALKITPAEARRRRHEPEPPPAASGVTGDGKTSTSYALARRTTAQEQPWEAGSSPAAAATAVATPPHVCGDPAAADAARVPPTVDSACHPIVQRLVEELERGIHYHESVFAAHRVEQVLFIGGEASNRRLCRQIAARLGLPAKLADPVAGLLDNAPGREIAEPRSAFAVAIGLSLGATA